MVASTTSLRIGIYGPEEVAGNESRGCALWDTGYAAAVRMAGGEPVILSRTVGPRTWGDVGALVWTGRFRAGAQPQSDEVRLCNWCRKNRLPLLAVDDALLVLNTIYDGGVYVDLCKERPDALQHRHPPEKGLR